MNAVVNDGRGEEGDTVTYFSSIHLHTYTRSP